MKTIINQQKKLSNVLIMSGRGKGGKGLGKGGAKRHRKVLRDNIQGKIIDFNRRKTLTLSVTVYIR